MSKGRKRHTQSPETKDPADAGTEGTTVAGAGADPEAAEADRTVGADGAADCRKRIEYLKRIGKRQAAPFARRHWVEKPKRPGRKAGKGKFAHRELPKVVKISETKEAKLQGCPDCGGHLQAIRKHEQFVTDIPVVEVKTTHFVTYSGYCTSLPQAGALAASGADFAGHGSGRCDGGTAGQGPGCRPQASPGRLVWQGQ